MNLIYGKKPEGLSEAHSDTLPFFHKHSVWATGRLPEHLMQLPSIFRQSTSVHKREEVICEGFSVAKGRKS